MIHNQWLSSLVRRGDCCLLLPTDGDVSRRNRWCNQIKSLISHKQDTSFSTKYQNAYCLVLTAKKQKNKSPIQKSLIPNPTKVWSAAKKSPLKHSPELRRRNHGPRSTRGPKRHRSTACSAPHAGNPSHHCTTTGPPAHQPPVHKSMEAGARSTEHGGRSNRYFRFFFFFFSLSVSLILFCFEWVLLC